MRIAEIKREGPRIVPEKVRRRGLCRPSLVSIVVLFCFVFYLIEFFIFYDLNVGVRKSRIKMKRSLKRNPEKCAEAEG